MCSEGGSIKFSIGILLSVTLIFSLMSAHPSQASQTVPVLDGDLDGGGLTISDPLMALRLAIGVAVTTPWELDHGDVAPLVNGKPQSDGFITVADALLILRRMVGLPSWELPDASAPSAPRNLAASYLRSSDIGLAWSPAGDNVGVAGYEVWRDGATIAAVSATSYRDTALSGGTTYDYQVVAFDVAGNLSDPSVLSVGTPASGAAATLTMPGSASPGWTTATISPGTGTVVGRIAAYASYQFDATSGVPTGLPLAKYDACGEGCVAPTELRVWIPPAWPSGSYFFCVSSPGLSCAKMELSNPNQLSDQGECTALSPQGGSEQKYDIVFVADHFSADDIQSFRTRIDSYREALLSVPPFSENPDKLMFWKLERLGSLELADDYLIPDSDTWAGIVTRCGGGPELVAVVQGPAQRRAVGPFTINSVVTPWLMMDVSSTATDFVREFGHAFANLGYEHENNTYYYADPSANINPNTDVAFCPKWCSGQPNTAATLGSSISCWGAWQTFTDCMAKQGQSEACWIQAADLHNGWFAGLERCDFGTGCQPGTGCFWGALGTNRFRSTEQSIMSGAGLSVGFNPPSQQSILNKLDQY